MLTTFSFRNLKTDWKSVFYQYPFTVGCIVLSTVITIIGIDVSVKELPWVVAAFNAALLRFVEKGEILVVDPAEVWLEAVVGDDDVLKAVVVDVMDENGSRVGAAVDSGGLGGFVEMLPVVVVP